MWIPFAVLAWRYWFLCDDAFITFRYARNLARGHGLRFNVDAPPVEGYSNFLWLLVSTACEGALLQPTVVLPGLSAACGAILIWRTWRVATTALGQAPGPALAGTLLLATAPAMGVWASSGLETMPFAMLVFLAFEALVLGTGRGALIGGFAALVGVVLIRAEGPAWTLVILALAAFVRMRDPQRGAGSIRELLPVLGAILVAIAGYTAFRYWEFGDWVSNTARAKVEFTPLLLVRGLKYVGLYALTFPGQVAVLAGAAALLRSRPAGPAIAAMAVAFPAFSVVVGGDFFPMGRMLLPSLPFLALVAGAGFQWLWDRFGTGAMAGAAAVAVALNLLPAWNVHVVPDAPRRALHFRLSDQGFLTEHDRWQNLVDNSEMFILRGRALANYARPEERIVARAIGAVGYYSGLFVYDQYGLIDPEVARRPLGLGPLQASPGHDREVEAIYFADEDPDYLFARYVRGRGAAVQMEDSLQRWAVPHTLRNRYVPEFVRMDLRGESEPGFLFVVRHARSGERADQMWSDYEDARRALHRELKEHYGEPTAADRRSDDQ